MSFAQRCDMCGKIEGRGVTFDSRPLSVRVKNHRGHKYNIYALVGIELTEDAELSRQFMENDSDVVEKVVKKAIKEGVLGPGSAGAGIKVDQTGNVSLVGKMQVTTQDVIYPSLKNPAPSICDRCRRVMLQYCQSYGTPGTAEF